MKLQNDQTPAHCEIVDHSPDNGKGRGRVDPAAQDTALHAWLE